MTVFPLSPPPSYFVTCSQAARNGIWYVGDTVIVTLSQATPNAYELLDYYGNVVASGAVSGTSVNLGSGLDPGWYRLRLTGASSDTLFGPSYGTTNVVVVPEHPNFQRLPVSVGGYYGGYIPSGHGDDDYTAAHPAGLAPWNGHNFDSPVDMITRGCIGLGIGRLSIIGSGGVLYGTPFDPEGSASDTLSGAVSFATNVLGPYWLEPSNPNYRDHVRERTQFVQFPSYGMLWDILALTGQPGDSWAVLIAKDGDVDADHVYITSTAGTVSGRKIVVEYPTPGAVVETFDNINPTTTAVQAAVNGVSDYILAYRNNDPTTFDTITSRPIGTVNRQTVAGIVAELYPLGVTRFEGPWNEGLFTNDALFQAGYMRLFQAAVHDGHPDAKAIGPCPVTITDLAAFRLFLAYGGGDACDEIAFHDYNTVSGSGDINQGRNNIEAFLALLAEYGFEDKPLWQTEANHTVTSNYGLYRPRLSRRVLLHTLLWEQYGLPMERDPIWYDWSHGFWDYASFMFMGYGADKSCNPWVPMYATLAREVFGLNFDHRVDFGCEPANKIFIGNVYGDGVFGPSVVALVSTSHIPGSSVTLTVTGATGSLVAVDAFGSESTATITTGRCTVDVGDVPTYVRLPQGAHASVYSVNDWGHNPSPSISSSRETATLGGVSQNPIADDQFMTVYTGDAGNGITFSTETLPDSLEIMFSEDVDVERVVIWMGTPVGAFVGLLDYDIDTWDGAVWTTQETVDRAAAAVSTHFGSDATNAGCIRETFWDEQWIEDVKIPSPVTCSGVRVYVRATSYGGSPDAATLVDCTFSGVTDPVLTVQEVAIISPSTPTQPTAFADLIAADSPVGWWRLGEASGTVAASEVNSPALDGTYNVAATLGVAGAVTDGDTAALVPYFNQPVATIPDHALLRLGDGPFTLEAWVKSHGPAYTGQTIQVIRKGSNFEYALDLVGGIYPDTTAVLKLNKPNTGVIVASTAAVPPNEWSHVAATKNGAAVHLYINGVDVTGSVTDLPLGSSTNALSIGSAITDEVAVYASVLSAAQLLAHYVSGLAAHPPTNASAPTIEPS